MSDSLGEKAYLQSKANAAQLTGITNNGQIKKMVVLTQAEYDALPASKTSDNTLYMIKG